MKFLYGTKLSILLMGGALVTKRVVIYFERRAVFVVHLKALYITNTERFSFKSGRVVKLIKEDWPIYSLVWSKQKTD